MAKQMNSPAICPVSSLSNRPAHAKPMKVQGSSNQSDCSYAQIFMADVPDTGPHVEIDHGPMHGEEFWEKGEKE